VEPSGFDPAAFSGTVPLFPLSNVVLFPHAFLPLHIFEPRYRAMTLEALQGERMISMAFFQPGWEKDYYGNPPVRDIVGVGKILSHEKQPDGRYNIVLYGVARARIVEVVSTDPYRTAKVELLGDRPETGTKYERPRKLLLQFYNQILRSVLKNAAASPPADLPLGPLCDLLAAILSFEPAVKQSLLEELDVASRCDRLLSLLQASNAPGFGPGKEGGAAPWSTPPSLN
jgi:uncharacterized protein